MHCHATTYHIQNSLQKKKKKAVNKANVVKNRIIQPQIVGARYVHEHIFHMKIKLVIIISIFHHELCLCGRRCTFSKSLCYVNKYNYNVIIIKKTIDQCFLFSYKRIGSLK